MGWSLDSVIIRPGDGGDEHVVEASYAIQSVLDATTNTISWYGAGSDVRNLKFVLFENDNGGTGLAALKTKVRTNADVALTSDQGAEGNFRMRNIKAVRIQDHANTLPVYRCTSDLIKSS